MKIRHKFASLAYILPLFVFVQITNGFPFPRQLYSMNSDWNISSVPRSIVPHVTFKQHVHHLPPRKSTDQIEDELLANLESLKQRSAEAAWVDPATVLHPPSLLDKTLEFIGLKNVGSQLGSKFSCTGCRVGAGLIKHYINRGESNEKIIKMIRDYCVNLHIQSVRVCEGVSQLFGDEVIYVLRKTELRPHEICAFFMGDACDDTYSPNHEWNVTFPQVPKPDPKELPLPADNQPILKVLHISDTHYDPYYEEGANANCNEPLCCRGSHGFPSLPENRAGKWGDYRKCDTPKRTIDHLLDHIAETHTDLDYIVWTGDLVPHDVWNQSKSHNLQIIKEAVKQMTEKFPNVPIFPALGNHESSPVNSFPPPSMTEENITISWLYDELDTLWSQWLPNTTSQTIRRGAFYSVLVRPGFRIITLNMNYCNNKNWWLLLNNTDPAAELQWLIYELQSAEFSNEKVHIIGHIPPGESDCLKIWSRNYYSIISRYESTIIAQFYGHTHFDEFEVFYDPKNLSRATNIAYIGPSVTPYENLNPGYRIYYIDGDHDASTRMVIDHENWVMNLNEANQYDYPIWYKLYSTRYAYSMDGLRPQDWHQFVNNMTKNDELFDLYHKHYWKNSPNRPKCTGKCKRELLCSAKSGRSYDRKYLCQGLMSELNQEASSSWGEWIQSGISASDVNNTLEENSTNVSSKVVTIASEGSSTIDATLTNEVTASEDHKESPIVNERYDEEMTKLLTNNRI